MHGLRAEGGEAGAAGLAAKVEELGRRVDELKSKQKDEDKA